MRSFIAVIISLIILSSCANRSQNDLERFDAFADGVNRSIVSIHNSTNVLYHELEQKLSKPISAQQASVWWPKTQSIKEKTESVYKYTDSLIYLIEHEAGLIEKDGKLIYRKESEDAVRKVFGNKKTGDELYQILKQYKQDVLNVDTRLKTQFETSSIIISKEFDLDSTERRDFTEIFFKDLSAVAAIAMLRQFENNIRMIENEYVTYCNNKVADNEDVIFDSYSFLISQTTNQIKGGDEMIIKAGMGRFSVRNNPVFIINGKVISSGEGEGTAMYKFKSPLKAGKYSVPVKIEYTDDQGKKQQMKDNVEYTVIE